jgi:hypothetical protein
MLHRGSVTEPLPGQSRALQCMPKLILNHLSIQLRRAGIILLQRALHNVKALAVLGSLRAACMHH